MEVQATLRFITPCLGDERHETTDKMRRDSDGKVIFLQAWWRSSLRFGAQGVGRCQKDIDDVQADPLVDGQLKVYKRFYNGSSFKAHEAFLAGDEIKVRFCLPNQISLEIFQEILIVAGKYVGISPYGFRQNFGRFAVIAVDAVRRLSNVASNNPEVRQPDQSSASVR